MNHSFITRTKTANLGLFQINKHTFSGIGCPLMLTDSSTYGHCFSFPFYHFPFFHMGIVLVSGRPSTKVHFFPIPEGVRLRES